MSEQTSLHVDDERPTGGPLIKRGKRRFGLLLIYRDWPRPLRLTKWYATARDREQARQRLAKETWYLGGLRWNITEVSR